VENTKALFWLGIDLSTGSHSAFRWPIISHHYRMPGPHGTLASIMFCILQSCSLNCITCRAAGGWRRRLALGWFLLSCDGPGFKCPPPLQSHPTSFHHAHRGNSIFYYVRPSWKQCNVNKILPQPQSSVWGLVLRLEQQWQRGAMAT